MITTTCPVGSRPGDRVRVLSKEGTAFEVTVPAGVREGQPFQVKIPTSRAAAAPTPTQDKGPLWEFYLSHKCGLPPPARSGPDHRDAIWLTRLCACARSASDDSAARLALLLYDGLRHLGKKCWLDVKMDRSDTDAAKEGVCTRLRPPRGKPSTQYASSRIPPLRPQGPVLYQWARCCCADARCAIQSTLSRSSPRAVRLTSATRCAAKR